MSSPASSCLGGAMTAHSIWPRKRSKRPSGHHSSERSDPATANASLDDKSRKSYQGRIAPLGPGASRVEWMMNLWRWRPQVMKRKPGRKEKRRTGKLVLRLPDLEVAKSAGCGNTAREGRKEAGRPARQLVDRRTGASTLAGTGPRAAEGQTRSCAACPPAGLWTPSA